MKVLVVESPAKAKTINKYLGKEYEVLASFGHIRDLPAQDGVPQDGRAVGGAADEQPRIRAEGHAGDGVGVSLEDGDGGAVYRISSGAA